MPENAMRHAMLALVLAAMFGAGTPAHAQEVQDTRLRGSFVPTRAPEGDARPASGEVRALVEADGDVRVDLVVSGLSERATSATLHTGDAGENGEQVARMDVAADGAEARVIGATMRLSPLVAGQVRAGQAYVVLRTSEHPDGILRAQLSPQARSLEAVAGDE
jgi:hypothetical protein